jgi:hypothetical protein
MAPEHLSRALPRVRAQCAHRPGALRAATGVSTAAAARALCFAAMKVLAVFVVVIIAALAGFTWLTLHWSYSEGERAGYLQKFSRRGWICKTWEGELWQVTLPGTVAEKFPFTVRDDAVAATLNANIGKRMTLHYEQRKWVPSSCFGDTEYFITAARPTP